LWPPCLSAPAAGLMPDDRRFCSFAGFRASCAQAPQWKAGDHFREVPFQNVVCFSPHPLIANSERDIHQLRPAAESVRHLLPVAAGSQLDQNAVHGGAHVDWRRTLSGEFRMLGSEQIANRAPQRLTMARDAGSKPSTSYIPPNLRYSATFLRRSADGFGITSH
jgi:hypothetical protein